MEDPSKKVLVVSLSNWVAQVKMEAMLAKALQVEGYRPVVATLRTARWAHRYYRVFGFEDLVFFDELLERVPQRVTDEAEAVLRQPLNFSYLYDLRYRNAFVGRHVLSSIVRDLRNGSVAFDDPQVMMLIQRLLPSAFRSVWASEMLLEMVQPQILIFLEKGYVGSGEIFDVAVDRGVNTIQFTHSQRSDALILKRYSQETRHMHPFALSEDSWEMVLTVPWDEKLDEEIAAELRGRYEGGTWFNRKFAQQGKHLKAPEDVRAQLNLDPQKKTAVIFSHVLWDATFFFGKNLFRDYEEWLVETVKVACNNPAVNWIIKIHPDYMWKLKQLGSRETAQDFIAIDTRVGNLPAHVKVLAPDTDLNTFSVFGITDYGITVRGTVGIELSCLGTPVFTAGTGRYSGLGFTIDSETPEEFLDKLYHIQEFPPRLTTEQAELAKKYAYAVFKLRPLPFQTFEMIQMPFNKLGHPLDHNTIIRASSFREIKEASDLKAFSKWVIDSHDDDFLMPLPR